MYKLLRESYIILCPKLTAIMVADDNNIRMENQIALVFVSKVSYREYNVHKTKQNIIDNMIMMAHNIHSSLVIGLYSFVKLISYQNLPIRYSHGRIKADIASISKFG